MTTDDPDVDDQNLLGHGSTPTVEDTAGSVFNLPMDNQLGINISVLVATSVFSDMVPNIEHTLDQLTVATDLFDIPALDFGTAASC